MSGNLVKYEIFLGSFTILTGVLYVFRVYSPTESEVAAWGGLAVILGLIIVLLGINKNKVTKLFKMILVFLLIMIQLPPIILWFSFHGSGISDGTPPSNFVALWIFAIPHMVIMLVGIVVLASAFKKYSD